MAPTALTYQGRVADVSPTDPSFTPSDKAAAVPRYAWVPLMWSVGTSIAIAWALFDTQALHMVFGSLAALIASLPLLSRNYRILSPWTPVALAISLAAGVRGVVQSSGLELRLTLDYLWFLGRQPEYFLSSYIVYIVGVTTMTAVYMFFRMSSHPPDEARELKQLVYRPLTLWIILGLAGVGFAAFVQFVQATDGFSLASLSQKRTTIDRVELSAEYESHGEIRWLNGLSAIAFWFAVAYFRSGARESRSQAFRAVVLGLLFLNALALPLYASSRSEVAYLIIVTLVIRALIGRSALRRQALVVIAVGLITVLAGMTFMRATLQSNAYAQVTPDALLTSATEGTVYDRTFGDMATSAHIIANVPERLEYQNGATIAQWLVAPVPRAIWPEKPLIAPGPLIGQALYGTDRSGVPPGYIAEMYWNFGLVGVLVGAMLLGWLLARLEAWLPLQSLRADPLLSITYAVVFFRFGLFAWSGGLGAGLYRLASEMVLLAVVSHLIAGRVALSGRRRRTGSRFELARHEPRAGHG